MSAVAEQINVGALIPDSIEPIEMHRVWTFDGKLRSVMNNEAWEPGAPFVARCRAAEGLKNYRYVFVRGGGMTLEEAQAQAPLVYRGSYIPFGTGTSWCSSPVHGISAPKVAPPQGYGYTLEEIPDHASPDEGCTCGIYAASDIDHGYVGDVSGTVKMWGRIIPGEKGARAEFAYPSELCVPARLATDPGILAYGVPVVVAEDGSPEAISLSPSGSGKPRMSTGLKLSIGANLAACGLNLSLVGAHLLG